MKKILLLFYCLFSHTVAIPFQLSCEVNTYLDTIVAVADFEYDEEHNIGGGYVLDFDGNKSSIYILYNLGSITHFGSINAMIFDTPYTPMDLTKTYSVVTSLEDGIDTVFYLHRDSVEGMPLSYSEMLLTEDNDVSEYILNAQFTDLNDTTKIMEKEIELIPCLQKGLEVTDEDYYPNCAYYVAYIKKNGRTLRMQVSPPGRENRSYPYAIRFSTDSAGNGKFKLKDTPILQETLLLSVGSKISVKNSILTVPTDIKKGTVTIVNLMGREVFRKEIENNFVSLKGLSSGVYSVIVLSPQGTIKERVLVE